MMLIMRKKKSEEKEETHLKNNFMYVYLNTFKDAGFWSESKGLLQTFEPENIKELLKHARLGVGQTTFGVLALRVRIS